MKAVEIVDFESQMCRALIVEPWQLTGVAGRLVFDEFEPNRAGIKMHELRTCGVDVDGGLEGFAADVEFGDDIEIEHCAVKFDGAVEITNGDANVVTGGVGHTATT